MGSQRPFRGRKSEGNGGSQRRDQRRGPFDSEEQRSSTRRRSNSQLERQQQRRSRHASSASDLKGANAFREGADRNKSQTSPGERRQIVYEDLDF